MGDAANPGPLHSIHSTIPTTKIRDEINYPFHNFNGASVEVLEQIKKYHTLLMGMWLVIQAGVKF